MKIQYLSTLEDELVHLLNEGILTSRQRSRVNALHRACSARTYLYGRSTRMTPKLARELMREAKFSVPSQ